MQQLMKRNDRGAKVVIGMFEDCEMGARWRREAGGGEEIGSRRET